MTRAAAKTAPKPEADEAGRITPRQMRELHAVLRDHGITGDKGVHDYLTAALIELGSDPVESRTELSTVDAARIIADLEAAEVAQTSGVRATTAKLRALRAEFPAGAIGKLPRLTCKACRESQRKRCDDHQWVSSCPVCNGSHSSATMHIDYVGHADITARLLDVDPEWTWEPFTTEQISGLPPAMRDGLWINLTVLGITRPGYGSSDGKPGGNGIKEAIGDALRNGAMRFGVALDLWAKGDRDWAHEPKTGTDEHPDTAPPVEQTQPPQEWHGPTTDELILMIDAHAQRAGETYESITERWRKVNGDLTVSQMEQQPPWILADLEAKIADWLLQNPPGETAGAGT